MLTQASIGVILQLQLKISTRMHLEEVLTTGSAIAFSRLHQRVLTVITGHSWTHSGIGRRPHGLGDGDEFLLSGIARAFVNLYDGAGSTTAMKFHAPELLLGRVLPVVAPFPVKTDAESAHWFVC